MSMRHSRGCIQLERMCPSFGGVRGLGGQSLPRVTWDDQCCVVAVAGGVDGEVVEGSFLGSVHAFRWNLTPCLADCDTPPRA